MTSRSAMPEDSHPSMPSVAPRFTDDLTGASGVYVSTTGGSALSVTARSLIDGLGAASPKLTRCEPSEISTLMQDHPRARFLVLVEAPQMAVAGALAGAASDGAAAARQALQTWRSSGQLLLQVAQSAPARCLFAETSEACASVTEWRQVVSRWLGGREGSETSGHPVLPAVDTNALDALVASAFVKADPGLDRLFEELLACCVVLDGDAAKRSAPSPEDALSLLQDLHRARQNGERELSRALAASKETETRIHAAKEKASAELAAVQQTARKDRKQLEEQSTAARRETDVMLQKLHEAQEQLGHYYLECRALQSVPTILARQGGPSLRATGVHLTGQHREGNHQHANLRLRDVELNGRRRPDLDVRLVDHLGRPGIVLFAARGAHPPLSAWRPSGQEAGAEFMLIVPSDTAGQAALQPMGSADWRLVVDLAGLILRGTQDAGPVAGHWPGVARRLCRQLADLPPRLRYDRLDVQPAASEPDALRATFGRVMFGALDLDELTLSWQLGRNASPHGEMRLVAPPEGYLPLAGWPVTPTGEVADDWVVPAGGTMSVADKRHAWSSLSPTDRTFLLALLDALPAVAARASDAGLAVATDGRASPAAAAALHREARRLCASLAWRHALRRLVSRRR